jgi:hypothetical protein
MDSNAEYQLRVLADKLARHDQELTALRRRVHRLEETLGRHGIEVPKP